MDKTFQEYKTGGILMESSDSQVIKALDFTNRM